MLYTDSQRKPANFYTEPPPSGLGAVATMHLKNTDVNTGTVSQYELCSDDWNQALAWSEASATNSASYANLVATDTTARYFEFSRLRDSTPSLYIRARVYRCTYLDRSSVNLQSVATTARAAGRLNASQVSATELRTLSEYLWQFTMYNNTGNAVLQSAGANTSQGLSHTLYIASLTRAGGGTCDSIDVVTWTHTVDSATGMLQLRVEEGWSYGVRRNGGLIEYCSAGG